MGPRRGLLDARLALSLLGIPLTPKAIGDLILRELTRWVASGAALVVSSLGRALTSTTTPVLGQGATPVLERSVALGALVAVPLLLLAVIQAVLHQDLASLGRTVLVRLPLALLLGGAAVELVGLGLRATDELSAALLASAGPSVHRLLGGLGSDLLSNGVVGAGFGGALVAACAALVAVVLWFELVVRAAAIAVAALFLPLALAGLVWPATSHWARRLGETVAALLASKLVIAGVLALAGSVIGAQAGMAGAVEGVALLVLASTAPFALLRLVPVVESGAVSHLEGVAGRARRGVRAGASLALGASVPAYGGGEPPELELAEGSPVGGPDFDAALAEISAELAARERSLAGLAGDAEADGPGAGDAS
ncbi:MAG TPA: hypothetical protein VKV23_07185 [Acidimicrobiales bacterium]|nr:hypothetical protein [Acidimicrobiales bacterium]